MNNPSTIPEWEAYIEALPRERLWSQMRAVNSFTFAKALITEGSTMGDLETIVKLFTRRMVSLEIKLPEGGAFNLHEIAHFDPMAF